MSEQRIKELEWLALMSLSLFVCSKLSNPQR